MCSFFYQCQRGKQDHTAETAQVNYPTLLEERRYLNLFFILQSFFETHSVPGKVLSSFDLSSTYVVASQIFLFSFTKR
jgi:hypothetical protein